MLRRLKAVAVDQVAAHRKRKMIASGGAPAEVYDEGYDGSIEEYTQHYSLSRYLPVWEAIGDRLQPGARILEIGCGPAQLATMLHDRGIPASYIGFDFSPNAIELARQNLPGQSFEVADARTTDLVTADNYDSVICTEVLEHIADDLLVVERIPVGRQVLATVPDFDYATHVRFFSDAEEVRARYGHLFTELDISIHHHAGDKGGHHGTFFLIDGVRG